LAIGYNIGAQASARNDDSFAAITTYSQTIFGGIVEFVAPAASVEKLQSTLSRCATDANTTATGNAFLAAEQYGEFVQWLNQQAGNTIPLLCADDLRLGVETVTEGLFPPVANAGQDQTFTDSGSESVMLDGSASTDSDGTIVRYVWTLDGAEIATGVNPTVDLPVGIHVITLTVTDNDGLTGADEVVITVLDPTEGPTSTPVAPTETSKSRPLTSPPVTSNGRSTPCPVKARKNLGSSIKITCWTYSPYASANSLTVQWSLVHDL
jgi:hypothetical protein